MKSIFLVFSMFFSSIAVASLDFEAASSELDALTDTIISALFDGNEKLVYDNYIHPSTKSLLSLEQLEKIASRYRNRLGAYQSTRKTNLNYKKTDHGMLAEAVYLGSFAQTTADIDIRALRINNKWSVTQFSITSPLLRDNHKNVRKSNEILVIHSDVLFTGELGTLVGKDKQGREVVLMQQVRVLTARWRMSDTPKKTGYVSFDLSAEDEARIKQYTDLSVSKVK